MSKSNSQLEGDVRFGFLDKSIDSGQILNPVLISNSDEHKMLKSIRDELTHASHFVFSVAFISSKGIALIKEALVEYKGTGEIITSDYLHFNEPQALRELLILDGITTYIHKDKDRGFHAKGYIFHSELGVTAIVGSSNLTDNALLVNQEWNLRFSSAPDGDIAYQLDAAVQQQKARSAVLTEDWISSYEKRRKPLVHLASNNNQWERTTDESIVVANSMQVEALEALQNLQESGENKAVIISATGTGKTILAALAVRATKPQRLLFIVHREQILNKAISEFQRVLGEAEDNFGKFVGTNKQTNRKYVFATVQSLSKQETLDTISPESFDYIIIDEVHRAGADSYKRIIEHFTPVFFLGLTATPERTDGFNVFELFDFNVPYEIRLHKALEENMLVPFHYYGVTDFTTSENVAIDDLSELAHLVSSERVHYVIEMLRRYGHLENVKGLMFCSKNEEARELSELFNSYSLHGKQLRTKVLTGGSPVSERESVIQDLEQGRIDYILTVDIFNEGIDIPAVNQIVMLRSTQSSIIFTQQLGRGLRKSAGKDHLRVIDFIGNYQNNYLIPVALFGDNSRNKESIRKNLLDSNSTRTLAGVSSINFDPIAQDRILNALNRARLIGKQIFKKDIQDLVNRLGKLPSLFDFARFDTVDPVLIGSKYNNYWKLLLDLKFINKPPTATESGILNFLSGELLPGKRPHELLLLRLLIRHEKVTYNDFVKYLESQHTLIEELTLNSVEKVLSLDFYTAAQNESFGGNPIVVRNGNNFELGDAFRDRYFAPQNQQFSSMENFKSHVDDIINTGLFLAQERGFWSGQLKPGALYSRREACRILNWQKNQESTIYGYKFDTYSSTVPIFVTYHKDAAVSDSTKYEDEFLSKNTMRWFTRNPRRLDSPELQPIINEEAILHLFVKKSDAEGTDFYYLGKAAPENEKQEYMKSSNGKSVDVVTMNLNLDSPVDEALYDYLINSTTSKL